MQNHIYERVRNLNTEYLMFLTIYCQWGGGRQDNGIVVIFNNLVTPVIFLNRAFIF